VPLADAAPNALQGAIATVGENGTQILVYAYSPDASPAPESRSVEVDLPADAGPTLQLHRIDSRENNALARWRALGSPTYLHPRERDALAAVDALQPSTAPVAVTSRGGQRFATFDMESPGVALLTIGGSKRGQSLLLDL